MKRCPTEPVHPSTPGALSDVEWGRGGLRFGRGAYGPHFFLGKPGVFSVFIVLRGYDRWGTGRSVYGVERKRVSINGDEYTRKLFRVTREELRKKKT